VGEIGEGKQLMKQPTKRKSDFSGLPRGVRKKTERGIDDAEEQGGRRSRLEAQSQRFDEWKQQVPGEWRGKRKSVSLLERYTQKLSQSKLTKTGRHV